MARSRTVSQEMRSWRDQQPQNIVTPPTALQVVQLSQICLDDIAFLQICLEQRHTYQLNLYSQISVLATECSRCSEAEQATRYRIENAQRQKDLTLIKEEKQRLTEMENLLQVILHRAANLQKSFKERCSHCDKVLCQSKIFQRQCLLKSEEAKAALSAKEALEKENESILQDTYVLQEQLEALQRDTILQRAATQKYRALIQNAKFVLEGNLDQMQCLFQEFCQGELRQQKIGVTLLQAQEVLNIHLQQFQEESCLLENEETSRAMSANDREQVVALQTDAILQTATALKVHEIQTAAQEEKTKPLVERVEVLTNDVELWEQSAKKMAAALLQAEEDFKRHLQRWQEGKESLLIHQEDLLLQNEKWLINSKDTETADSAKEPMQLILLEKSVLLQEVQDLQRDVALKDEALQRTANMLGNNSHLAQCLSEELRRGEPRKEKIAASLLQAEEVLTRQLQEEICLILDNEECSMNGRGDGRNRASPKGETAPTDEEEKEEARAGATSPVEKEEEIILNSLDPLEECTVRSFCPTEAPLPAEEETEAKGGHKCKKGRLRRFFTRLRRIFCCSCSQND